MTRARLLSSLPFRVLFLILLAVAACSDVGDHAVDVDGAGDIALDDRVDCGAIDRIDGGTDGGDEPVVDPAILGEPCGEDDSCPSGTTCVSYYGVAGPAGPELETCEITCARHGVCPEGTTCLIISDGPGEVCRPSAR